MRLEKKKCDLGINRTTESQSDCKDRQRFLNGCNKLCSLTHRACKWLQTDPGKGAVMS